MDSYDDPMNFQEESGFESTRPAQFPDITSIIRMQKKKKNKPAPKPTQRTLLDPPMPSSFPSSSPSLPSSSSQNPDRNHVSFIFKEKKFSRDPSSSSSSSSSEPPKASNKSQDPNVTFLVFYKAAKNTKLFITS